MNEEYTCSVCGNTYLKDWSDEEAMEEYNNNFPEAKGKPAYIVCDDCYNEFMEWWRGKDT